MTGSAWTWYMQMDPDIAEDWGKLQMAMVNRWPASGPVDGVKANPEETEPINIPKALPPPAPQPETTDIAEYMGKLQMAMVNQRLGGGPVVGVKAGLEATEPINIPKALPPPPPWAKTENIPAAAPAPAPAPAHASNTIAARPFFNLNETKTGRIRVDCPGSKTMYISSVLTETQGSKGFAPNDDKSKALVVEITQKSVHYPQEIRILNSPDHRRLLGIAQIGRGRLGEGSTEFALLVTANSADSSAPRAAVIRNAVWSICPFENTIRALWQRGGSEFLLKSAIASHTKRIVFTSDIEGLRSGMSKKYTYPEVNLVFEPLS